MKVILLYLHVESDPGYFGFSKLFMDTYRKFPAGAEHELWVVNCNGPLRTEAVDLFSPEARAFCHYRGGGFDIGAEQSVGRMLCCDFLVCACSSTHFRREGWLKRLVDERRNHGDGLYSSMSSNEIQPHLRTALYAMHPDRFREYPYTISSKDDSYRFEHREWCVSNWMQSLGKPAMLVTWDGCYARPDWRKPPNIFRRGDQSNCISFDRHTYIFETTTPDHRRFLEASSG